MKIQNNTLNIVMYHYIKTEKENKKFRLNTLNLKTFENQIINFKKKFNVVGNDEFCDIIQSKKIPKKPCFLLTFDDGYKDHYKNVFPILVKHKIKGIFYPTCSTLINNELLYVNKVQILLGKINNKKKLLNRIYFLYKKFSGKNLSDLNLKKINLNSRFDTKDIILIKRLLQYFIKKKIREKIVNTIMEDIFEKKSNMIFKNFYLNLDNIKEMMKFGMTFGLHGYEHNWLTSLNKFDQEKEIKSSINFFKKKKILSPNISFCFPYGDFDNNTIKILKKYKFKYAVTTEPTSYKKITNNNIFKIPRFDCNDFV